jgi:putative endonuclease
VRAVFFVYILSILSGTLYVGLTDDLPLRMMQHKNGEYDGFTKKYEVNRLMYYEGFTDSNAAAAREKQIKTYSRAKKIALFKKSNPQWKDLSKDLYSLKARLSLQERREGRAPSLSSGCL